MEQEVQKISRVSGEGVQEGKDGAVASGLKVDERQMEHSVVESIVSSGFPRISMPETLSRSARKILVWAYLASWKIRSSVCRYVATTETWSNSWRRVQRAEKRMEVRREGRGSWSSASRRGERRRKGKKSVGSGVEREKMEKASGGGEGSSRRRSEYESCEIEKWGK